jgi:hypothetical protein
VNLYNNNLYTTFVSYVQMAIVKLKPAPVSKKLQPMNLLERKKQRWKQYSSRSNDIARGSIYS